MSPAEAMALTTALAAILTKVNEGNVSKEDALKEILDVVFGSGIPAGFLCKYLTENGRQYAETAVDLAEFAKLEVARMKEEMKTEGPLW